MWSDIVAIHPWVGAFYATPRHFKCRILIVGEAGYATPQARFMSGVVIDAVRADMSLNLARDVIGFGRFSTKLRRTVLGREESIGVAEFWENVAFYNFVQPLAGDLAQTRAIDAMWRESIPAFLEVMALLAPTKVLVLGNANWRMLLSGLPHQKTGPYAAFIEVASQWIEAGFINHPSSALLYSRWRPVAKAFLFG